MMLRKPERIVCTVQCGKCCDDYWMDVFPGWWQQGHAECPYATPKGCRLAENARPDACITYECEVSSLARRGLLSKEDLKRWREEGETEMEFCRKWWKKNKGKKDS